MRHHSEPATIVSQTISVIDTLDTRRDGSFCNGSRTNGAFLSLCFISAHVCAAWFVTCLGKASGVVANQAQVWIGDQVVCFASSFQGLAFVLWTN